MGVKFTEEQQKVIDLRDRNILVSAAAGSGKTAVLVERIITRLTKDANPIDVDRLLIVTYTEAAAAEMKERIRNAIEKALKEQPENAHLQRQATLIHHAQITTIHSFCLSVIRDYFHTIDLDPGFRIGETGELKLLQGDVLEEVLEKWYQESAPAFIHFVESFVSGKSDHKLNELILKLYEYSRSYPNPQAWLDTCVTQYEVESVEALERTTFVQNLMTDVKRQLEDVEETIRFAKEVCLEEDGPSVYATTLDADLSMVERLSVIDSFAELYVKMQEVTWDRLATNRDKMVSEEKQELVKSLRQEWKTAISIIEKNYFLDSPEVVRRDLQATKENMCVLVELVKAFDKEYQAKKQSKNIIDFSDMEHYALRILTEELDGTFVPSIVAKEYQETFLEVMIDEYQDSNFLQDTILTSVSTVSSGKPNVFMVGDVKQSIYRFRLSRPELFMEKYASYSATDGMRQKVDLHKNFRSRREVLESTNFVFEQIMAEEFGGIEYDANAALNVGAKYEEHEGNETEICFVDTSQITKEESARELEAVAVAGQIKELVGKKEIFDVQTEQYRKIRYSDIVILTRTVQGWADLFVRVLGQEGVPAYSGSKTGYFETREIGILLDYLRILDNPRQDIPFAAVLTSPFCELTGEELAKIKTECEALTFYERTRDYVMHGKDLCLQDKLKKFFEQYDGFRSKVPYTAIHTLLWMILEETGYENYMAALPGGEQRAANVDMLVEKAIAFENTSYKGLFHFVRYIEQLQKYNVDYDEANVIEEYADVVRIMSIHKSKGLEFPVVFVVGMNKRFNMQDTRASIVFHPQQGVGMDAVDLQNRTKTPTLLKRMIQKEVAMESVAEELRVLYVAMTRAKEKLILVGAIHNMEKQLWKYVRLRSRKEKTLPYSMLTSAQSYFDWLIPALYRNQVFAQLLGVFDMTVPFGNSIYNQTVPIKVNWIRKEQLSCQEVQELLQDTIAREILTSWDVEGVYDEQMKRVIHEQFGYSYPYTTDHTVKQKVSVSELKKKLYLEEEEIEEEEIVPLLPKFLQKDMEMTGAMRGTVYHKVLECLDFAKEYDLDSLKDALRDLVERGIITDEALECIWLPDIIGFLNSNVGRRMQKACRQGKFHVEQPFVLGEEATLVQGIIDAYFEEEGELVVVDYKTDRVKEEQELVDRYQLQLDYYAKALHQITEKPVKERVIYSFALHQEIQV